MNPKTTPASPRRLHSELALLFAIIAAIGLVVGLLWFSIARRYIADREKGLREITRLARANRIPTKKEELYPPYTGDENLNAYDRILALQKTDASKWTSPTLKANRFDFVVAIKDLSEYHPYLVEASAISKLTCYWPHPKDDGYFMEFPEFPRIRFCTRLLTTSGQCKAIQGDLLGACEDFEAAVRLTNFCNDSPTLFGASERIACQSMVLRSVVESSTRFKGHDAELRRLVQIPQRLQPTNWDFVITGEAYKAVWIAQQPAKAMIQYINRVSPDNKKIEVQNDEACAIIDSRRHIWGPQLVGAYVEDLKEIRKSPLDPTNPALVLKNVSQLGRSALPIDPFESWAAYGLDEELLVSRVSEERRQLALLVLTAVVENEIPKIASTSNPMTGMHYHLSMTNGGWTLYGEGRDGQDHGGTVSSDQSPKDVVAQYDGDSILFRGG